MMTCEVGTCLFRAAFTEFVVVVPWDPSLYHERHKLDVVLCHVHERQFTETGLHGVMTMYGDTITTGVGE
ncbi:MAG: hypothetical protein ABL967_13410 [Bryobacteraceae bacterium]